MIYIDSRKLYLSDIARITNPKTLINETVFDLDVLTEAHLSMRQLEEGSESTKIDCSDYMTKPDQPELADAKSHLQQGESLIRHESGKETLLIETHTESENLKAEPSLQSLSPAHLAPEDKQSAGIESGDKEEPEPTDFEAVAAPAEPEASASLELAAHKTFLGSLELEDHPSLTNVDSKEQKEDVASTHSHPEGGDTTQQEAQSSMPETEAPVCSGPSPIQLEYEDLHLQAELEGPEHQMSAPLKLEEGSKQQAPLQLEYEEDVHTSVPPELLGGHASPALDVAEDSVKQHTSGQQLEYEDLEIESSICTAQEFGGPEQNTTLKELEDPNLPTSPPLDLAAPNASTLGPLESDVPKLEATCTDLESGGLPANPHETENQADTEQFLEDLEWEAETTFSTLATSDTKLTSADDRVEPDRVEPALPVPPSPPPVASSLSTSPHLEFESRFESGNLRKAIQVKLY